MKYADTTDEQRRYYSRKKTIKGWNRDLNLPIPTNATAEIYNFVLKHKKVIQLIRHEPQFFILLMACKELMDASQEHRDGYNNFIKEQGFYITEKKITF